MIYSPYISNTIHCIAYFYVCQPNSPWLRCCNRDVIFVTLTKEMKRDESQNSITPVLKPRDGTKAVVLALADTTWRIAVPTVLLAGLGIVGDKWRGTMPLLTLTGLFLGLAVGGKLVWDQVKALENNEVTK